MTRWGSPPDKPRSIPSADRRAIWLASKELDGLPGEWTFLLWSRRAEAFHVKGLVPLIYKPCWDRDEIVQYLANGYPVQLAMDVFESIYDAPEGRLAMPLGHELKVGTHAVLLAGVENGEFIFPNSWGENWGVRGWGRVSFEYVETYGKEAWSVWCVPGNPPIRVQPRVSLGPGIEGRIRVFNERVGRYTVERLEFLTAANTLCGWVHLVHDSESRISIVEEMYVWPTYRGKGLGKKFWKLIRKRAKARGNLRIKVYFHHADILSDPAINPAETCSWLGIAWHPERRILPCLEGFGEGWL